MDDTRRRLTNTEVSFRSGRSRLLAVWHLLQVRFVDVVVRNPGTRMLQEK